jgi:phage gp37-like protein
MGGTDEIDGFALVTELARKSAVCWLGYGEPHREHVVWHVWHDDAIGVVAQGEEQPLPGIERCTEVVVTLRAKTTRHRLASCRARVERVQPGTEHWESLVPALVSSRLNLPDQQNAPVRWAAASVVLRLVPVEVLTAPGNLPDGSGAAVPVGSPATTTDPLPRVLHRRQTQRPPLS